MSNFKDEPIQLISIADEGLLELTSEGIKFLSEMNNQRLSIISIVGQGLSGKSSLLNTFMNISKGFSENTKGIYIWGRPIEMENGAKMILLDTQGLNKNDKDKGSQKVFMLSALLSTCMIYNIKGELDEEKIKDIDYYSELASKVLITPDNGNNLNTIERLSLYFPEMIMTLRDYENKDKEPNEYMNEMLSHSEVLSKLFNRRKCFYCPSYEKNEEFTSSANTIFNEIKSTIGIKKIDKFEIDGEALYGILQNYLDSINNDENPIITLALKNVLLSKAKNISEKNIEAFKVELTKKYENKYPLSITDVYKHYFELQSKEIFKFCNDVQDILTIPQTGDYLNKLSEQMQRELENIFDTNKEYYDNWFDIEYKEIEKELSTQTITKLSDIKSVFTNYTSELQKGISKLLDIPNSDFCKNLINLLMKITNEHITSKISKLGESISELYEKENKENESNTEILNSNIKRLNDQLASERKQLEEKTKEKNELYGNLLELETKYDKITREFKAKEKDFDNNINIELQKYQKMENYYLNQLKEKESTISKLESQVEKLNKEMVETNKENSNKYNEIIKENAKLQEEIAKLKEQEKQKNSESDSRNLNYQSLVKSIQNTFMEFQESVDKLYSENKEIYQTKNLEYSIKEVESKTRNWLDEISLFRDNQIEAMKESYEKKIKMVKDEVEELRFELAKLNYALNEQNEIKQTYETEMNVMKKQVEEERKISEAKNSLISTQENSIKLYEDENISLKKVNDELEMSLNQNVVNYKMKEDEMETLLIVIEGMLSKKKDKYEHNLARLSADTKSTIQGIVDKYKFFK